MKFRNLCCTYLSTCTEGKRNVPMDKQWLK